MKRSKDEKSQRAQKRRVGEGRVDERKRRVRRKKIQVC